MNKTLILRALLVACGVTTALAAHATLIDFETLTGGTSGLGDVGQVCYTAYGAPLATQGYAFTGGTQFGVWLPIAATNTTYANYINSAALFQNNGVPITLSQSGGGTFDLLGLDIANIYRQGRSGIISMTFTGTKAAGGSVTQTYTIPSDNLAHSLTFPGFTGLSSFLISGTSSNGYQLDNVNVQAVPEPASLAVLGLGVLAVVRRRRANL